MNILIHDNMIIKRTLNDKSYLLNIRFSLNDRNILKYLNVRARRHQYILL